MQGASISRRRFLGCSAAWAGTMGAAMGYMLQPASPAAGADPRICLGLIGAGAMGRWHLERLLRLPGALPTAIADPDRLRLEAACAAAAQRRVSLTGYADYRAMLDKHPELDAVIIATPDHWHAVMAVDAMRRGLDIYCELPLAMTIAESRAIVEAAARYQRVVHTGADRSATLPHIRAAGKWVRDGRIGRVRRAECFFGPNPHAAPMADEDPPPHLDWALYVGPSGQRPYNRRIHPYNFRYVRGFSGGPIGEWGAELFGIALHTLQEVETGTWRVVSCHAPVSDNYFDFPAQCDVAYDLGGLVLEWHQGGTCPLAAGQSYGVVFYGSEGDLCVNRGGVWAQRHDGQPVYAPGEWPLCASPDIHEAFFADIRRRCVPAQDLAAAHRAGALAHVGNIAMELGRPLEYDPDKECFSGDPEADARRVRPLCAPWQV